MGASSTPRASLEERLEELQPGMHTIPREEQVTDAAAAAAETLVLERDEMQMLEAFHRSFNLPGLKLGLVRAVCEEDWLPPEDDAEDTFESLSPPQQQFNELPPPRPPPPQQQQHGHPPRRHNPAAPPLRPARRPAVDDDEPEASKELSELLARTRGLTVEAGHVLEDEEMVAEEEEIVEEQEEEEHYMGEELAPVSTTGSALISRGQVVRRPGSAAHRPCSSAGSRPPSSGGVGSRPPSTGGMASSSSVRRRW